MAGVIRVKDYDEALELANDTEFGLSAGICTTSLKFATHFKRNAEAGMVMVNVPTAGVDFHVPFGGSKGSSFGPREQAATPPSSTPPSRPHTPRPEREEKTMSRLTAASGGISVILVTPFDADDRIAPSGSPRSSIAP